MYCIMCLQFTAAAELPDHLAWPFHVVIESLVRSGCWNIRASWYLPITIFVEYSIFSTLQCLLRAHYKHDYLLDAKSWSLTRNLQHKHSWVASVYHS